MISKIYLIFIAAHKTSDSICWEKPKCLSLFAQAKGKVQCIRLQTNIKALLQDQGWWHVFGEPVWELPVRESCRSLHLPSIIPIGATSFLFSLYYRFVVNICWWVGLTAHFQWHLALLTNSLQSKVAGLGKKRRKVIKQTNLCQELMLNMPSLCMSYSLYMKFIPRDSDLDVD